jgi:predicted phage terminase large subunit-like protein
VSGLSSEQIKELHALPVRDLIFYWDELEAAGRKEGKLNQVVRMLCLADLYYLLVRVCGRVDMLPCVNRPGFIDNQFAFERCREVEAHPDGYLDLWSRELWKSSIITFGLTLQTVLKDPEITIGIFSHTRPIAKAFLRTLMREMEGNRALHAAFPDVFYGNDTRAYQKFSEDDGVIVKRKTNPNESTIEAWGLVDGQPTSRHFQVLVYDDVVVQGSVSTPEMIAKTMTAMELSYNLGTTPGVRRAIGTRYHFNDAYSTLIERGTFKRREYPGRIGGTEDGESIVWSEETHHAKRAAQGPHTYASQILLNPKADSLQGFQREWLRTYRKITPVQAGKMNKYILVDAASSKKKGSDFTAIWVIGLGTDGNYYALDMVRDRLSLTERADRLFDLHRRWKPRQVRYERYGLQSDIEHLKSKMEADSYRFDVTEVAGQTKKADRIGRLIPIFEQGKMWLPKTLHVTDYQKNSVDLVRAFVEEEYAAFPVGIHDDMLDALARIAEPDLRLVWPRESKVAELPPPRREGENRNAWMM